MKTTSKEKIEKAQKLASLIEQRKQIEKEETELKEYFKDAIKDSVLEAGGVIILIENRTRESLDKVGLETLLGEKIKQFLKVTEYEQVTVKKVA